jgi:MoaA/NifB/PqqE/SkfB family radical SAM enzyme
MAKVFKSFAYNYYFNPVNGFFARWGKTLNDDPSFSPIGPEILDIEISVNGCPNGCAFCYKGNTPGEPVNMTLDTFKTIIDKMPSVLQVAFGITGTQTNPDFIQMMEYCRSKGIIPNFTLSGIDVTDEFIEKSSKLIGAVAVSCYQNDKNICYDTVAKYVKAGIKQTNIHFMISQETKDFAWEVIRDIENDPRLEHLNALVFLGLKPKGRAKDAFHILDQKDFYDLVEHCMENDIPLGFDSCSANRFVKALKQMDLGVRRTEALMHCVESCESFGLFSSYINVYGDYFPCSFAEGVGDWAQGISVTACKDFLQDVWHSDKLEAYRQRSIAGVDGNGCRTCLIFPEVSI